MCAVFHCSLRAVERIRTSSFSFGLPSCFIQTLPRDIPSTSLFVRYCPPIRQIRRKLTIALAVKSLGALWHGLVRSLPPTPLIAGPSHRQSFSLLFCSTIPSLLLSCPIVSWVSRYLRLIKFVAPPFVIVAAYTTMLHKYVLQIKLVPYC